MRYFITGIKGFIPSHFANHACSLGHEVVGIDNNLHPSKNILDKRVRVFYGDVRYYEDIDSYVKTTDKIFHFAAQINVDKSIDYPQETMDINLNGTMNILNACRRHQKTMVFSSTSEIYGTHTDSINENSPTYAQSPYAVAKLAADKMCGNYHSLYGVRVFRVRGFNTFGPFQGDDQYGAVIPKFVKLVMNGKPPIIFGDGKQLRDYIYIDDVVRAYEHIPTVESLVGTPVNVGTGKTVSINEIAQWTIDAFKKKVKPIHILPRPGEVRKLQADIKLLKSTGYSPKVGFKEGLEKFIQWYTRQS